jgi:hypothetical protein
MRHAVGADGLVALVAGLGAAGAFFFDVGDLAVRPHFAIPAGHTPALERREPEQADKTHRDLSKVPCNRDAGKTNL